jgi:urease accessory protein
MHPNELALEPVTTDWQARLALGFERRDGRSVLARREHFGPLRVQKSLHPEGPEVCHAILLHPPAGIAGGDELDIRVNVENNAHALLTTPGATKWYRSAGLWAQQKLTLEIAANATLEWLPQETIVFDSAYAKMQTHISLAGEALFMGWEVLCLGRRASGEKFERGTLQLATRVELEGKPIWIERGKLQGGSPLLDSPIGLNGYSVSATLLAAGREIGSSLLARCREVQSLESESRQGITTLPKLLVARYLGHSSEAARGWFIDLWRLLRPALAGRDAQNPRIWNT